MDSSLTVIFKLPVSVDELFITPNKPQTSLFPLGKGLIVTFPLGEGVTNLETP